MYTLGPRLDNYLLKSITSGVCLHCLYFLYCCILILVTRIRLETSELEFYEFHFIGILSNMAIILRTKRPAINSIYK